MTDIAHPGTWTIGRSARVTAVTLALLYVYILFARYDDLPVTFFRLQDRYVIGLFVFVLGSWSVLGTRRFGQPFRLDCAPSLRIGALLIWVLGLWAGAHLVMDNFALTRDEHMVIFDMGVFRSGRLGVPLPVGWRGLAEALVPNFLLDIPGHAGLVSSYMPVNAAMRAGFGLLADPALLNPLLAGAGLVALYRIARQLFDTDREARAIVLLLYVTSAQVIVAAMTNYAMTGHLAFNLIWLALFLRDTKRCHVAALAIGFLATGLHQVVFHPLFVAPFLPYLVRRGQWRTALFYAAGYLVIGLFWMSYPHLVLMLSGFGTGDAAAGAGAGPLAFVQTRIVPLLTERDPAGLVIMVLNLLRFVAWQNLALVPLALVGLPLARRGEGIAQPLYYGVLLTVFAMFVLLPYQGHGWGYRYLHGLIGSMALLAGYGWSSLGARRDEVRSLLRIGTIVTMVAAIPFLLVTTHVFIAPYARVDAAIGRLRADMAVIDTEKIAFGVDEVRNPSDLSARPIRLASAALNPASLGVLCRRGSLAFVTRADMQRLGLGREHPAASPRFDALRASAPASCRIRSVTLR